MKKLLVAVFLFAAVTVFTAVWFSPLGEFGAVRVFRDNTEKQRYDGLCYPAGENVRVDFSGDEAACVAALAEIGANTVKRDEFDGLVTLYAYSPRVCATAKTTSDGKAYNVMAVCANGNICIGVPIVPGCY